MNNQLNILDMLETSKIKDENEFTGYGLGIYNNKMSMNGFYLRPLHGSLLERIEQMTKMKFQLENDPENYSQEARVELWLSIQKYYDKFGANCQDKPDGFVFTDVKYKMMDKAKLAKGNVSVCDRNTGKYHINKIESFEQKFIEESDKIKNQKDERFICELYNILDYDYAMENESSSEFVRWLHKNKEYVLTQKQIDYLNGDVIINDVSGEWRLKKNIIKRIEESYNNDKIKTEKINKYTKQLKTVGSVLNFKSEEELLNKLIKISNKKNNFIIILLYENLNKEYCMLLTNILHNKKYKTPNKQFYYDIINILIDKEQYLVNMIENIKREDDGYKWD